jgi:hypothetical protein
MIVEHRSEMDALGIKRQPGAVPPQEPGIGITWDRGTIEKMRID